MMNAMAPDLRPLTGTERTVSKRWNIGRGKRRMT